MDTKICPRCNQSKPLTLEFYRRLKSGAYRRWQSYCLVCEREWRTSRNRLKKKSKATN